MQVGDLITAPGWYPHRKRWDQKRVGLIVGLRKFSVHVRWSDSPDRVHNVHNDWFGITVELVDARR